MQSPSHFQDTPKNESMSMTVRAGLQRVYLEGMDYMKARIKDIQDDIVRIQCEYYQCPEPDEEKFEAFLKECDTNFLRANTELRKRSIKLEVIDGETRLVSLLNQVREFETFDPECVTYLTKYWENVKSTVETLRTVVSKFQETVLNRLKQNYISYNNAEIRVDVCVQYTEDITGYISDMERILTNTQILLKSFNSGIHQDLYDKSRFAEMLIVSCDLKAFPLLRFVADVCGKLDVLCDVALTWLTRDERFMYDVHEFIRQTRSMTRRREEDLRYLF